MFDCIQKHHHPTAAERDGCDARTHDMLSLVKMARVGFSGPAKVRRVYEPGHRERRNGLEMVVFSEEQVVPWNLVEDEEE
jgi:hypothetical protein